MKHSIVIFTLLILFKISNAQKNTISIDDITNTTLEIENLLKKINTTISKTY